MKKFNLSLLLFFCVSAVALAQTFTNDKYGYSIDVDDNYQLARNDDATYFRSQDGESLITIKNWPGLTEEAADDYMKQGYQDQRIAMVATGKPEKIELDNGSVMKVDIQGIVERELVKGVAASFIGNDGQGMVVLVSGPDKDWGKLKPIAQKTIASVKFTDFTPGPDAFDWYYMLAGTRLSLRGTENDRSRKEDLYFCSNGRFKHRVSASAMRESDTGSSFGFSSRTGSGAWTVADVGGMSLLKLRHGDGNEESIVIEDRNGKTFLDGQRYYMMRNHRCR